MLASGLMSGGMNWWQALFTILLGNTHRARADPAELATPARKYGIPFPVFARAAFGTVGSNVPALMRALVACGWFGIQTWIGGEAMQTPVHGRWSRLGELLGPASRAHHHRVAVVPAVLGPRTSSSSTRA